MHSADYAMAIPFHFHLFCKENGCQNATVNNAIESVKIHKMLKLTNRLTILGIVAYTNNS